MRYREKRLCDWFFGWSVQQNSFFLIGSLASGPCELRFICDISAFICDTLKWRGKRSVAYKVHLTIAYRAGDDYIALADVLGRNSSARNIAASGNENNMTQKTYLKTVEVELATAKGNDKWEETKTFLERAIGENPSITTKNLNLKMQKRCPDKPFIPDGHLFQTCHEMLEASQSSMDNMVRT